MTRNFAGINQQELRWKPATRYLKRQIPRRLRAWLFDQSSLTARLQHHCGERGFSVQLHSQRRSGVLRHEAMNLGMEPRRQALIRQVHLLCGDQPVVFARTIIPLQSLKGRQRRLAKLGQRSLGAILFADKSLQRGNLELSRLVIGGQNANPAWGRHDVGKTLWGRRSTFTVNGHRLLVSEFFLPALFHAEPAEDIR